MMCPNCRREIADYSNFCYFCGSRQSISPSGSPVAHKRLMRSVTDRKVAGVCGGVAEYMELDSTVVRIVWALLIVFTVPVALIGYFVAWLVMPEAPLPSPVVTAPQAAPQSTQTA